MSESLQQVKEVLRDELGFNDLDKIRDDSSLVEDLGCDSIDCVEIIMAVEEVFDLEIADEAADKWVTVQNIAEYVDNAIQ